MFTLLGVPRYVGLTNTLFKEKKDLQNDIANGRYYLFYLFYVYHIMSMFTLGRIAQIYGDRVKELGFKASNPTKHQRIFSRLGYDWVKEAHRLAFSINEVSIYY